MAEAIRPYVVRKLIQLCRQADPRVTVEEIASMIDQKAPHARKSGNFAAYLWKAVPEPFADGGLDEIRAAPSPHPTPPALPLEEQYEHIRALLKELPEGHEQRPALEKNRDELRRRLFAEGARKGRVH